MAKLTQQSEHHIKVRQTSLAIFCSTCATSTSPPCARHSAGEADDFIAWVALSRHAELQAESVRPGELEVVSVLMDTAKVAPIPLI